jgi:hypothetical protein
MSGSTSARACAISVVPSVLALSAIVMRQASSANVRASVACSVRIEARRVSASL